MFVLAQWFCFLMCNNLLTFKSVIFSKNNSSFETEQVSAGQCGSGEIVVVDSSGILIMT